MIYSTNNTLVKGALLPLCCSLTPLVRSTNTYGAKHPHEPV